MHRDHQDLLSFPTRRSSDLCRSCSLTFRLNSSSPLACKADGETANVPLSSSALNRTRSTRPSSRLRRRSSTRSEEHTSELQSRGHLVCRLLLEKKRRTKKQT